MLNLLFIILEKYFYSVVLIQRIYRS